MTMPQVQEIGSTPVYGFLEKLIPAALKAVIFTVATIAAAVFGYLLAGVTGLAIGTLAGAGLGLKAISAIFLKPIDPQYLTDLTDPEAAQGLVEFYQALPEELISDGPTSTDAREIQAWMVKSRKVRHGDHELDLSNQGLTQLPKEIGVFRNVRSLLLGGNQLQSLPEEIRKLKRLHRFDLNGNQLRELTDAFGLLRCLEYIDLSNNQLQEPPDIITDFLLYSSKRSPSAVKYLNFKNNHFDLPVTICHLELGGDEIYYATASFSVSEDGWDAPGTAEEVVTGIRFLRAHGSPNADRRNPYSVLNIDSTTDKAVVKKAYTKMSLRTHPDKNFGDNNAKRAFLLVKDAYQWILKDIQRKTE
jgi:hypothetical protein